METQRDEGFQVLRIVDEGALLTVHLCNPPANAMGQQFVDEMKDVLAGLEASTVVRAVLIVSDLPVFALGGDIKMLDALGTGLDDGYRVGIQEVFNRVEALPFPVVACIEGHALGGGLELALACDVRIAADHDDVRIGVPEIRLGLLPGAGGTQRLGRLLGRGRALDLLLSGRPLTPREAHRWGLVTQTARPEEARALALERARGFAEGPTRAYAAIKECVRAAVHDGIEQGLELERAHAKELMRSADAAEGMQAFLEKRPANFTGG